MEIGSHLYLFILILITYTYFIADDFCSSQTVKCFVLDVPLNLCSAKNNLVSRIIPESSIAIAFHNFVT